MADKAQTTESELFFQAPLLINESREEFNSLAEAFVREIKPRGIVEQMYVADFAYIGWEILRLRHCKVAIINTAFKDALSDLVSDLVGQPSWGTPEWVKTISLDWYTKPNARKEVLKLLKKFNLDESVIEAKAIQNQLSNLETLDKMLTLLESRRNKALRSIADYRESFADQVRKASTRLIDGGDVIQLEDRSVQKSA
jgi:hypothetical protein